MNRRAQSPSRFQIVVFALVFLLLGMAVSARAQATRAPVSGEIEVITLDDPADVYSGGTIVVGGQVYIVPRNLLIDLPANRLTLQQIFEQAPAACPAGETGIAKSDSCNTRGTGGFATISANRTSNGNVIVGDLFIEKGLEALTGIVTYIDYGGGYYRVNGIPGDAATGVMVRLNDPSGRHTLQQGLGCAGGPNCSPDPRFALDSDNYTNSFSNGYPLCIPSTQSRTFADVLGLGTTTAQAQADGTGDVLCPSTNRTNLNASGQVPDSRRFAPVMLGDNVLAEGSFETIGGVRFLSAHTSRVGAALGTKPDLGQPDYLTMAEVFVDAMGFQNKRARALFIGFSTGNTDMRIWSRHWDPDTNTVHEFPLASVAGCDLLAGAGEVVGVGGACGGVGLATGPGGNIFKIHYDIDFLNPLLSVIQPELYPCAVIRADPEWSLAPPLACSGPGLQNVANNFAILSPTPHEIHVKSRKQTDSVKPGGTPLVSIDVQGQSSPNGQYIFPMGINLGGIETPEFVEINLGLVATPWLFTGLPWNLDRRLSPGGCQAAGGCEGSPQPLDPFPFEGLDPRLQEPLLPNTLYNDPLYTASALATVRNRILSFVDAGSGVFDGDNTVLAWPPANPAAVPIAVAPQAVPCSAGGGGGINEPVVTNPDAATTFENVAVTINLLLNDTGSYQPGTVAVIGGVTPSWSAVAQSNGTVVFTPAAAFSGEATFSYTVEGMLGSVSSAAVVTVTVIPGAAGNNAPVANGDAAAAFDTTAIVIPVLANDTDEGVAVVPANVTATLLTQPSSGSAVLNADKTATYTPVVGFQGNVAFTYRINDGLVDSNAAAVTVAVTRVNVAPLLAPIADRTVTSGTLLNVLAVGTDSPGDTLVYSLTTAPAGMTINAATGLISWTPGGANVAASPVTVKVTDQGGLFAARSFTVTGTPGFWQTQFGFDGTQPVVGDFEGDGISDIGFYYPPGGNWYLFESTAGFSEAQFGYEGTIPVVGDFDGDGSSDIGVYYPPGGNWYLSKSTEGFFQTQFGYEGTIPVVGDFDGDGRSDIGAYYPPGGNWYLFKSTEGFSQTTFGYAGTLPVVGDFDGDGRDDIGAYYPAGGNWYVFKSTEGFWETQFGFVGTLPVAGDFDGDGRHDIGVYYPPGGNWYFSQSTEGFWQTTFGYAGTVPVVGDFDGDGRDDPGVYYAPGGGWYAYRSTEGFWLTFGFAGTIPLGATLR